MQKTKNTYKKSGVNINLADRFVNYIAKVSKKNVQKKNKYLNKDNIGAFGSTFDISQIKIKDPLIVSSTDGVGTKLDLANKFNKFDTIGIDLVAMCVNDLIVQGAKPLFFLDYMAIGKIKLNKMKKIVDGIVKGCNLSDCNLIGGETAEMPGIYSDNKFDLAGFSVGIVSKKKILHKKKVFNGNVYKYGFKVTDKNLVVYNSDQIDVSPGDNLSISLEEDHINAISFYPNPATNIITIKKPIFEESSYTIIDSNGKIVNRGIIPSKITQLDIDISHLSKGIYMISLNGNQTSKTLKIIKNNFQIL